MTDHLLYGHKASQLDEQITVERHGESRYFLKLEDPPHMPIHYLLSFQRGPVGEHGPNGVSNESVITVLIDRLQQFQQTPSACEENQDAIHHLEQAMAALKNRTQRLEGNSNE